MVTDEASLVGYYIVVFLLALIAQGLGYLGIFLGANLIFLGFIVWLERSYIPVLRRNHYVAILVSVILISLGLLFSQCI